MNVLVSTQTVSSCIGNHPTNAPRNIEQDNEEVTRELRAMGGHHGFGFETEESSSFDLRDVLNEKRNRYVRLSIKNRPDRNIRICIANVNTFLASFNNRN